MPFFHLSQPLNLWALLSTRLFGNLTTDDPPLKNCHTCEPPYDLVAAYAHACLQCMPRQYFIPSCLQGNIQLRRGRTINTHSKALRAEHTEHSAGEAVHSIFKFPYLIYGEYCCAKKKRHSDCIYSPAMN